MAGESQQAPNKEPDPTVLTTEQLERAVANLRDYVDIKVDGNQELADLQFTLIERQRVEQKKDSNDAIQAALQAQKEQQRDQTLASEKAISKSESSTTTEIANVKQLLSDLKDRVGVIEAIKVGATEFRTDTRQATTDNRQANAALWQATGVVIAALAALGAILIAVLK